MSADAEAALVAHGGIEPAEGLIEQEQPGMKTERADEGRFHALAAREMAQAAIERQVEKAEELLAERLVPSGIERAEKGQVLGGGDGIRQVLAIGDVADLRAVRLGERARCFAKRGKG